MIGTPNHGASGLVALWCLARATAASLSLWYRALAIWTAYLGMVLATSGIFFNREADRAWEHCRSSKTVSLKKLVKTDLALAKQNQPGGERSNKQPNKNPKPKTTASARVG